MCLLSTSKTGCQLHFNNRYLSEIWKCPQKATKLDLTQIKLNKSWGKLTFCMSYLLALTNMTKETCWHLQPFSHEFHLPGNLPLPLSSSVKQFRSTSPKAKLDMHCFLLVPFIFLCYSTCHLFDSYLVIYLSPSPVLWAISLKVNL